MTKFLSKVNIHLLIALNSNISYKNLNSLQTLLETGKSSVDSMLLQSNICDSSNWFDSWHDSFPCMCRELHFT